MDYIGLSHLRNLKNTQLFLLLAGLLYWPWYFLFESMGLRDEPYGRFLAPLCALAIYFYSKREGSEFRKVRVLTTLFMLSIIVHYNYLLFLNNWNPTYQFGYLGCVTIVSLTTLTFFDFVLAAVASCGLPYLLLFWSAPPLKEFILFSACHICLFGVFGLATYIRFKYLGQIISLGTAMTEQTKMAALGEMSSGIAHEINNPLAIIQMTSENIQTMIEEENFDKDNLKQKLERIQHTIHRIAKIIRGLKTYARDSEGDGLVAGSLSQIISETLQLCSDKFRFSAIAIDFRPLHGGDRVSCRPSQLSQVVLNLMQNSYDAVAETEDPWIRISVEDRGGSLEMIFTDSGSGIPTEIQKKMFNPFFTTKEVGHGTGLGLSISQSIAKNHGGSLFINTKSPNTQFVLSLPKEKKAQIAS